MGLTEIGEEQDPLSCTSNTNFKKSVLIIYKCDATHDTGSCELLLVPPIYTIGGALSFLI